MNANEATEETTETATAERSMSGHAAGFDEQGRWTGEGRAPFQVLVLPYHESVRGIEYAIFHRADEGYWQFIAGGGEGSELPIEAARREAFEEARIPAEAPLLPLDSRNTVPVMALAGRLLWGPDVLVVPEFTFGVRIDDRSLTISREHIEYRWADYSTCRELLHWDSNRNALLELNHRVAERQGRRPKV